MHAVTIIIHDHTAQAQQQNMHAAIDVPFRQLYLFDHVCWFSYIVITVSKSGGVEGGGGGGGLNCKAKVQVLIVTTIHTIMIVTCRLTPLSQKEETQMHVAGMHTKVIYFDVLSNC